MGRGVFSGILAGVALGGIGIGTLSVISGLPPEETATVPATGEVTAPGGSLFDLAKPEAPPVLPEIETAQNPREAASLAQPGAQNGQLAAPETEAGNLPSVGDQAPSIAAPNVQVAAPRLGTAGEPATAQVAQSAIAAPELSNTDPVIDAAQAAAPVPKPRPRPVPTPVTEPVAEPEPAAAPTDTPQPVIVAQTESTQIVPPADPAPLPIVGATPVEEATAIEQSVPVPDSETPAAPVVAEETPVTPNAPEVAATEPTPAGTTDTTPESTDEAAAQTPAVTQPEVPTVEAEAPETVAVAESAAETDTAAQQETAETVAPVETPAETETAPAERDVAALPEQGEAAPEPTPEPAPEAVQEEAEEAETTTEAATTPPVVNRPSVDGGSGNIINRSSSGGENRLPGFGNRVAVAPETDASSPDTATNTVDENTPALERNRIDFDAAVDGALISIVLIDDGSADDALRDAARDLPIPLSFAVSLSDPQAGARASAYRSAGHEVAMMLSLPDGARPQDVETAFQSATGQVPDAVAVLDPEEGGYAQNREIVAQVIAAIAESGHGLLLPDRGLNAGRQIANRQGVSNALIFRVIDGAGEDENAMRRHLDRAGFKAQQDGSVIMMGHLRPETIATLATWALEDRTGAVIPAPVSAALDGQ